MTKRGMIVVGDKFEDFAANESVIRAGDVEKIIVGDDPKTADLVFRLGQGVSAERVERLIALATAHGKRDRLLFAPLAKCGTRHVHKRRPENSMLSLPRKLSDDLYEADLLLDDGCELMADHVSGQHLQGMVLIEAARQMILAVTEEYVAHDYVGPCSFIWNGIDVTFFDYAFPLPMRVLYRIKELDTSKKKRLRCLVSIDLIQGGVTVCSAQSRVEVFERQLIERREQKVASAAVAALPQPAHA